MKFRKKFDNKNIRLGYCYYVDFKDPMSKECQYRGVVQIIQYGGQYSDQQYYGKDWFYCRTFKNELKKHQNITYNLYIDRNSFRRFIKNY